MIGSKVLTGGVMLIDVVAELSTEDADKLQFSLILEPDSLGNLVTNMSVEKCAKAADAYREATSYVS